MNPMIEGVKRLMRIQLKDVEITNAMIARKDKEWDKTYKKISEAALLMIRDIERMEGGNYRVTEKEIYFILKQAGRGYEFLFSGQSGGVKIEFQPNDWDQKIQISNITEEIYDVPLTLV